MSIETPKNWWRPLHKQEKYWLVAVIAWCVVLLIMMPYGHTRDHNISQETYNTTPAEFKKVWDGFVKAHQAKDDNGNPREITIKTVLGVDHKIPVVDATNIPVKKKGGKRLTDGADVFLLAENWKFTPALILKKGKPYRIHMSSDMYQHGFSLLPMNLNYQVLPYHDFVVTITPLEVSPKDGFRILCNEYCSHTKLVKGGDGHHLMSGRIIVKE